jgi:hypothetical protein
VSKCESAARRGSREHKLAFFLYFSLRNTFAVCMYVLCMYVCMYLCTSVPLAEDLENTCYHFSKMFVSMYVST